MVRFLLIAALLLHYFSASHAWKNLDFLDLGSNLLEGTQSPSLCRLTNLKYLLLSDNQFSGTIAECLGNMSMQLTVLDLKRNKFTGPIPKLFPKGNTLRNLGLNGNQLVGTLPTSILNCKSLEVLDIGNNFIEGPFPDWLGSLPSLSVLILTRNRFYGTISTGSVQKPFQKLRMLDVSYNQFNGSFPEAMIENFEGMKWGDNDTSAKYRGDSSYYEDSVTLLFKGLEVELIRVLTIFTAIDLSGNSFEGSIPKSIGELKALRLLNLSHNRFNGPIQITGSNLLEGTLPPFLCKLTNLNYLLLSDNQFSGTIPVCLGNMSMQLLQLDLKRNKFTGNIPIQFPMGNTLRNLGLNGNQFVGTLPQSILNCKSLEVLDIGNNLIEGSFPDWLGSLPELSVLILTRNKFNGTISTGSVQKPFQKLRILDVSYNQFNGSFPEAMIENFEGMKWGDNDTSAKYRGDRSYYEDSVTLLIKGLEVELKRVLTIFTTIDLSGNSFIGSIPKSIGELKLLRLLNMSHNQFGDPIPSALGEVSQLESLDLSGNQLSGRIPPELGKLTFLAMFNVSENNLQGRIPSGNQFFTFTVSSYLQNPGLCGFPLEDCEKSSNGSKSYPSNVHRKDDAMDGFTWESVVSGFGCGMILGVLIGGIMLYTHKPKWFHELVIDMFQLQSKLYRRGLNWDKVRRY